MESENYFSEYSGDTVESIFGGRRVKAYLPPPLPLKSSKNLTGLMDRFTDRVKKAEKAIKKLGILGPNHPALQYTRIRTGANSSHQIEERIASIPELFSLKFGIKEGLSKVWPEDVKESQNYMAAFTYGWNSMENGEVLDQCLIRKMHEILFSPVSEECNPPGEYRKCQSKAWGWFYPPPPDRIADLMNNLERFIHEPPSDIPSILQIGIVHAQFQMIHPFGDGNGRIVRMLIPLLLRKWEKIQAHLVYLNQFLEECKSERNYHLGRISKCRNWEGWLDFCLDGIGEVARYEADVVQRLLNLFEKDEKRVRKECGTDTLCLYHAFQERPMLTTEFMVSHMGVLNPKEAIKCLESTGVVEVPFWTDRNDIFIYEKVREILVDRIGWSKRAQNWIQAH